MSVSQITSRYAKSFFDLAREKGVLEEVNVDMNLFYRLCKDSRELSLLLKSPVIPPEKKSKCLKSILGDALNPLTLLIFDIIIRKKRESILKEIALEFFNQYKKSKGIKTAKVVSFSSLTQANRAGIMALLAKEAGGQVDLIEKLDPTLIGGFIITIGDRQIDASISKKIRKLKREFIIA